MAGGAIASKAYDFMRFLRARKLLRVYLPCRIDSEVRAELKPIGELEARHRIRAHKRTVTKRGKK